jgi:hypothetical protein
MCQKARLELAVHVASMHQMVRSHNTAPILGEQKVTLLVHVFIGGEGILKLSFQVSIEDTLRRRCYTMELGWFAEHRA